MEEYKVTDNYEYIVFLEHLEKENTPKALQSTIREIKIF